MYQELIRGELTEAAATLDNFLKDEKNIEVIQQAAVMLADSFKAGGKVMSCGNGGSHCDAMHFAEELTGRYRENRPGYPAIAISDVSHLSCVSNDFGYEYVFSRFVESVGREGDVLLGISTSGNSGNIIRAVGGLLYLIGFFMFSYNIYKTIRCGRVLDKEPVNATPVAA